MSMGSMGYTGEGDVTYLLLHLADFEFVSAQLTICLLYTSDAADEMD